MSDISKYKKIVNDECLLCLKHLRNYDEKVFRFIIERHLSKTNLIINGHFCLPAISSFLRWKGIELFDIQRTKAENENAIFIVNTCVFCVVEYNPSSFLKIEK